MLRKAESRAVSSQTSFSSLRPVPHHLVDVERPLRSALGCRRCGRSRASNVAAGMEIRPAPEPRQFLVDSPDARRTPLNSPDRPLAIPDPPADNMAFQTLRASAQKGLRIGMISGDGIGRVVLPVSSDLLVPWLHDY